MAYMKKVKYILLPNMPIVIHKCIIADEFVD
jgi:hypothetical protein